MVSRPQQALQFFISKGWKPWQAAGIVGNLMQESGKGLNPKAVGDQGASHGIAQHRGPRFRQLQNFARVRGTGWDDFQTQLEFVEHEMRTSETGTFERLSAAKNLDDATAAFIGFERPKGWTAANPKAGHGWSNRLSFAKGLSDGESFAGGSVSPPLSDAGGPVATSPPQRRSPAILAAGPFQGGSQLPPLPPLPELPEPVPLEPPAAEVPFTPTAPFGGLPSRRLTPPDPRVPFDIPRRDSTFKDRLMAKKGPSAHVEDRRAERPWQHLRPPGFGKDATFTYPEPGGRRVLPYHNPAWDIRQWFDWNR